MRYHLLGRSGLRVAELCLGTMTFGETSWGSEKSVARRVYDEYRTAGGNFMDTANIYANTASESCLGEFMEGHRQSVVLATKYTNAMPGTDPNAGGNHRKSMMQSVEASLKRLKTDYIDLYWLHIWDQITPLEEVVRGFDDLVRQGKILYAGISDAPAWWIARFNTIAELRGWTPFVGLQIEYSLTARTPERELFPMAKAMGIGITAWSPLAGGVLSGKYHGKSSQGGGESGGGSSRFAEAQMKQFMPEDQLARRVIEAAKTVSEQVGRSVAQVALAWMRYRNQPVIPIIGARTIEQLQDNLKSVEVMLSGEQVKLLDEASAIQMGFPYDFYEKDRVKMIVYGGLRDRLVL
jgi:aryl-alcohol dehydrogenase-like predicted oxidoreductase